MTIHKRAFLRTLAVFLGGGSASELLGQPSGARNARAALFNWAGNRKYGTDRLFRAKSVEQIKEFVKNQTALKTLGARHCFNGIADSIHQLISLRQMNRVLELDTEKKTVTVQGGISYGQLGPWLDQRGYALHNLASLPHITVAGALATATHGSGSKNGNLATSVTGLEFVAGDGEVRSLRREKDGGTFQGAVVHLGALGILTSVTLAVQPTFRVREYSYERLPMSNLYDDFEAIMSSGYSVSLFTRWRGNASIRIKTRIDAEFEPKPEFHGATLRANEEKGVEGPWYERLPHFRMDSLPKRGDHLQSEYFVGQDHSVDALRAVARLGDRIAPLLFASEIRTVAADEFWMSTCYRRPSVAIHFTWKPNWNAVSKVLPAIEKALAPFQARPHWGKLFSMAPTEVRACYPRLEHFKQLVSTYDPEGKFRNRFLSDNLYV